MAVATFFALGGSEKVRLWHYGRVTKDAYHKEYKNLQPALEELGLAEGKNARSLCKVEDIATDGVTMSRLPFCGLHTDNFVEITKANKQKILSAAKQLDELSSKHNGNLQTNLDTNFSKYIADIANGVDYNPDFGATFVRDNYLCAVHMNVAFSKPNTPAYSIQFGCNAPRVTNDDTYLLPPCISNCDEEL